MKTKKELREEFKQMKYRMGVFQIRNKLSEKVYIGSSTDLKAIWFAEKLQLETGMHPNKELQRDWKESGADHFAYEILEEIKEVEGKDIDYAKEVKALEEMVKEELNTNKGIDGTKIY